MERRYCHKGSSWILTFASTLYLLMSNFLTGKISVGSQKTVFYMIYNNSQLTIVWPDFNFSSNEQNMKPNLGIPYCTKLVMYFGQQIVFGQ